MTPSVPSIQALRRCLIRHDLERHIQVDAGEVLEARLRLWDDVLEEVRDVHL